ncbi:MAG: IS630 family transposase [Actinomycetota bacterium]|nr:IS630 family transposase [Actinomycetota bacterium]
MAESDARSLSQDAQEALRVRGVKLVVEQGWSQVAVADALGVDERVVRRWMKRYRRGGWAALVKQRRGRRRGEQQALSAAMQSKIAALIVGHCPDQLRIPGLLWTRSAVQALIEQQAGVKLEVSTVGRYLRAWGFTLKKPSKRALEQDPVVVQAWLDEVYPALERRAKAEGALILWGDESGIRMHDLVPQAGYALKGQRAVARIAGRKAGANLISAIANGGQMSFRVFEGRFTADVFIDFLRRLIASYEGRKVYLVVDNHSTHHAKKVRSWLARDGRADKLELVFLPAYSPELNPDENLNQDLKRHLRASTDRPTDRPTLKAAMRAFLRSVQRRPVLVAAYFDGEHVTYAAA